MKIGDSAFVKKFRLHGDPFVSPHVEPIFVPGKVVAVYSSSFTVKYDNPLPDGTEYQEFALSQIPESVTITAF